MGTQMDLTGLLDRYLALHRAGDVSGLLELHWPDAEFVIPGQRALRGWAALRDLFAWDAVLRSELVMEGVAVSGDALVVERVIERNEWFRGLGILEVRYEPGTRVVWKGGRVRGTYPTRFAAEIGSLVAERFGLLCGWLALHRPDVLGQLLPEGGFRYDAGSARMWLEMMDLFREG